MNKNNIMVGAVVAIVVFSGASFYGGMQYARSHNASSGDATGAQARAAGRFGQGSSTTGGSRTGATRTGAGAPTIGSIVAKDDTSLTLQLTTGGSRIVFYTASTTVDKTNPSSVAALSVGDTVMVTGSSNPDGSVNAQSVQDGVNISRFNQRGAQSNPANSPATSGN